MSVADALSFENFMKHWCPPIPAAPPPTPEKLARDLLRRCAAHVPDPKALAEDCEKLFLCHFRCGGEALLAQTLETALQACPGLTEERYPRALLAALCLDPDFRTPGLLRRLEGLRDPAIVLVPVGAPWSGPRGLLRRWDTLPGSCYPVLDRSLPLPELRANRYLGRIPASGADPLYSLDPVEDLPELLEELLRRCSLTGPLPETGLSPLARLALEQLPPLALRAALAPGGVLAGERTADLEAFARQVRPPERGQLILSLLPR